MYGFKRVSNGCSKQYAAVMAVRYKQLILMRFYMQINPFKLRCCIIQFIVIDL